MTESQRREHEHEERRAKYGAALEGWRSSFVPGYSPSPEQLAGLGLAHYFQWDPARILDAAANALEDANDHKGAALLWHMAKGG